MGRHDVASRFVLSRPRVEVRVRCSTIVWWIGILVDFKSLNGTDMSLVASYTTPDVPRASAGTCRYRSSMSTNVSTLHHLCCRVALAVSCAVPLVLNVVSRLPWQTCTSVLPRGRRTSTACTSTTGKRALLRATRTLASSPTGVC